MLKSGGTDVATCYANRRPVEKSRAAKASPSNVELDTGRIETSGLERSVRKRRGGLRERRHRSTDFFYLQLRHLFRACGGALVLQIWPLLSA